MQRWKILALLGVIGLFVGCGDGPDDNETSFASGDSCYTGTEGCPCFGGNTCLQGLVCASGICIDPSTISTSGDEATSSGTTSSGTTDAGTTDAGTTDAGTTDAGTTDAGTTDAGTTDSGTTDSGTTDSGTTDSGTTGDGDGDGVGDLDELDRCTSDVECGAGLLCKTTTKQGFQRCVSACVSDAQCPSGGRCIDLGDGDGKRCLEDDVGRFCSNETSCNYGCLTSQQYCTVPCAGGSDCPGGYGCMAVGGSGNLCVKLESYCGVSTAECIAPSACDADLDLIVEGCTSVCNTAADCPQRAAPLADWTCEGGICKRPSDVFGPLPGGSNPVEYYCDQFQNVINLCNDGLTIDFTNFTVPSPPFVDCFASQTTTGNASGSCVNSCRYQGGCSYSYACNALSQIGGERIGLCLPKGGAVTGSTCTTNNSCEFGYCSNGICSRDCTRDGVCPAGLTCVDGGTPTIEGLPFRRCQ